MRSIAPTPSSDPLSGATLSVDGEQYALAACRSGDREYFLGVDLEDGAREVFVRLVIDPLAGPRLRVHGKGSRTGAALGPGSCRQLQAEVQPTGWRVNHVRDFSGRLDAECTTSSGQDIRVHVRFMHCH